MFSELGVPIYIADNEAKNITNSSTIVRRELIKLLGEEAYGADGLNRKFVADKIFNDPALLQAVNGIIHPRVAGHFRRWAAKQKSSYVIKEAAILFENGGYRDCDLVILVTAPKAVRISRIKARDKATEAEIEQRMKNQWSDEKKKRLASIIIQNIDIEATKERVLSIHESLK